MDEIPQEKHIQMVHYQQRFNWDCGISCILMILSATQRQEFLKNFESICIEEGFNASNSTWTIDLCYMLHRFNIRHEYYTKTLGIDPDYNENSYYTKIIKIDGQRIKEKFDNAAKDGLVVKQKVINIDSILQHMAKYGPVILLTNASMLTCDICRRNILHKFGYAGHYVVLCGYNIKQKRIFYRNPEVKDGHVCQCSMEAMDVARKAYGTDEDVILVYEN